MNASITEKRYFLINTLATIKKVVKRKMSKMFHLQTITENMAGHTLRPDIFFIDVKENDDQ